MRRNQTGTDKQIGTTSDMTYKGVDSGRKEGETCIQKMCTMNVDGEKDHANQGLRVSLQQSHISFCLTSSLVPS
jgi:hypothetical protein